MAGLADNVGTYGSRHNWQVENDLTSRAGAINRSFAVITFAALLASTVALNAFKIGGLPIRGLVAAGILVLAIIFYFDHAKLALKRNLALLGLAAGLAVLGVFVSLVNGAATQAVIRSVAEVHVQAAILLMVAAILAQVAGARACVTAIIAVIGISACVAVAQMMDMPSAWALRRALGPLPNEAIKGLDFADRRHTGLSFSAIQLATQLCLAFAAFTAVRDKVRPSTVGKISADPVVMLALLALFAASIACATRSPILGGLIFLAAYAVQRRTPWLPLFLILAAIVVYMGWPLLMDAVESNAPRVTRIDDDSAAARITLVYYGLRLLADNPLGYGLTFAPMTLWSSYWPDLYTMPAPRGVRVNDLHNYAMTMLNIYGVGILLLIPIIARLLRRAGTSLIFFVPYIVHILFHNAGPFYNDNVIWFVIAAIAATSTASDTYRGADFASTARRFRSSPRFGTAPAGSAAASSGPRRRYGAVKPVRN
jgi:hypothetical protein